MGGIYLFLFFGGGGGVAVGGSQDDDGRQWEHVNKTDSAIDNDAFIYQCDWRVSFQTLYTSSLEEIKHEAHYRSLMKIKTPLLYINYTRGQQSLDYQTPLMEQTWPVLIHFQPQRQHNIYKHKLTCATSPEATTFFPSQRFLRHAYCNDSWVTLLVRLTVAQTATALEAQNWEDVQI